MMLPLLFVLLLLLIVGLIIHSRRPALAMSMILLSIAALYSLSTPWVSGTLLRGLEISGPVEPAKLLTAQAIVVLGGGRRLAADEYGGDTLNDISADRLRYAALVYRSSDLPVLVTGGMPGGGTLSEGHIMQQTLKDDYAISPAWVEDSALTTWENAHLSASLLKQAGIQRIVLVTHAWHLRRAMPLFQAQGLEVIPAGTQFSRPRLDGPLDLLPTPLSLRHSTFALHEWTGILWYKLRSNFAEGNP